MVYDTFINRMNEMFAAINVCFGKTLMVPTLILVYSTIDALAYISVPAEKALVTKNDFTNWVNTYLLPDSYLPCNAVDLYGARCGLVHSQMADSSLSRSKKARPLFYY